MVWIERRREWEGRKEKRTHACSFVNIHKIHCTANGFDSMNLQNMNAKRCTSP